MAQSGNVVGTVISSDGALPFATVMVIETGAGTTTDEEGRFQIQNLNKETYTLKASFVGYSDQSKKVYLSEGVTQVEFNLLPSSQLDEVVVTGTLKEMSRLDSPVPVEVYSPAFLKSNPTPNMYEAMQNVNGVRPQLNCNVCNTGDIHINGLEGPYTMILIDGMPIVSGLASVYGLSGIPNGMIDRIEIVKGPASSLYGSEAVGGLINVITKKPEDAPVFSADVMGTSWQEYNMDIAFKVNAGSKASVLTGINYFNYNNPIDNNGDNFTDVTLQNRISGFQKWSIQRKQNRVFNIAGRYLYEDRWGGELQWSPEFRGGDSVYAESIYTNRWELVGQYQLPTAEKLLLSVSYNFHDQNSVYGQTAYLANQQIAFSQLTWDKKLGRHDLLVGTALRYTVYDDNTIATIDASKIWLPGIFAQDEILLTEKQRLLLGVRYDYNSSHGNIWTPRAAYKWSPNRKNVFRLNAGTGFRVINLFTEEHAALTGAREVVVKNKLDPEQSYNVNFNYVRKFYTNRGSIFGLDFTTWYTYFTNQILPDYDTDPDLIIYDNLDGYAVTRGTSLNADFDVAWLGLRGLVGATYMDVFQVKNNDLGELERKRPVLTERWTGTWSLTKVFYKFRTSIDYTGNLYGPMRLPTLGPLDPRDANSPWWSIQNIQVKYNTENERWEFYGGVKNLLNFTPPANSIARSHDPFDKNVSYDNQGNVISNASNPYALTFDPSYVYAPNQGIRGFAGLRLKW
ncbi:MAG: TonB-dependent receptor [Flavobacteriales bacterium]